MSNMLISTHELCEAARAEYQSLDLDSQASEASAYGFVDGVAIARMGSGYACGPSEFSILVGSLLRSELYAARHSPDPESRLAAQKTALCGAELAFDLAGRAVGHAFADAARDRYAARKWSRDLITPQS